MWYKVLIIISVIVIAGAFAMWDHLRLPPQINGPENGGGLSDNLVNVTVPNPSFETLAGKKYRLHDFKDKVVFLNFWATWCPPCVVEFPQLLQLAERYPDDMVLIALSVDETPENIRIFIQSFDADIGDKVSLDNVIIAHDPGKKISQDMFQTVLYPETFIIAPDLTIHCKIAGMTDWLGQDITAMIEALSQQKTD